MWQILIGFYFVFGTASYILRRKIAQKVGQHNRLINSIFFLFFLLPAIFILLFFSPHNLNVGKINFILLIGGSLVWPVANILAFESNRKVDVGVFTIINNLSPLFTLVIALPFLHEKLTGLQYFGFAMLILSATIAAFSQLKISRSISLNGVLTCLLTAVVLGVAVAYEKFMLTRVDFGAYLVYGWGAQITWALILARKELKLIPKIIGKGSEVKNLVLLWALTSVLKSISFITSLKLSTASVISSISDFLSVTVVIAAYFYLQEKENIVSKIIAVILGVAGLLLIAK